MLPTLLALIANSTDDEYRSLLQPELRKVIAMTRPVQVRPIITCTGEFNLQPRVSESDYCCLFAYVVDNLSDFSKWQAFEFFLLL